MDEIRISLSLADQAAQTALSNFIKNGSRADDQFKKLKETGKSTFQDISVSIGKTIGVYDILAGNLAANLVQKGFEAIKDSIGMLIDEASGSEQAIQNLNVALKNSGQFTPAASEELQNFAGSLQSVTMYSDEAIMSSSTLLLNLTSLSRQGVQQATRAAADLAATLNVDLNTATEMITKAINGNFTAFKKMGIEIQSASTDSDRLQNVLRALSSQVGASEAVTNTYAGAIAKAKNQKSELFEAIGKLVTQSDTYINKINSQASLYGSLAKFITENTQAIRDFGTALQISSGIILSVVAAVKLYQVGLFGLALGFDFVIGKASLAWAAMTSPVGLAIAGITATIAVVYQMVKNWDAVTASTYSAAAAILEYSAKATALVSEDSAKRLMDQAQAYRDQATAIRESAKAATEKVQSDMNNDKISEEQANIFKQRQAEARKESDTHLQYLKSTKEINALEIANIEAQAVQTSLDLLVSYNDEKELRLDGFDLNRFEKMNQNALDRLGITQEYARQELEIQIAKQVASANAELDDRKRKEELQKVNDKATLDRLKLQKKQELDTIKASLDIEKKLEQQKLVDKQNTTQLFVGLSQSENRRLAEVGRAAGLVQIAMDTETAVGSAYRFGTAVGGPALAVVFAALAATAMADRAATLAGIQFASGGIVPGTSYSGDQIQARLNSGEMVLNKTQQTELFKMANGQNNNFGNGITVNQLDRLISSIDKVANRPIEINGKEIFSVMRDQIALGRTY